jgi:hypothetical protein
MAEYYHPDWYKIHHQQVLDFFEEKFGELDRRAREYGESAGPFLYCIAIDGEGHQLLFTNSRVNLEVQDYQEDKEVVRDAGKSLSDDSTVRSQSIHITMIKTGKSVAHFARTYPPPVWPNGLTCNCGHGIRALLSPAHEGTK